MLVVVCYDITDDRRRLRVSIELENFGARVQKSVFECHLEETQLAELRQRLADVIDESEDRIRYYWLCPKDQDGILIDGQGQPSRDWDYHVI